jgi:hypothetical protein
MASAPFLIHRSRYGHHVVIAAGLSALYLIASWTVQTQPILTKLLYPFFLLIPVALAYSLFLLLFIGAYGLLAFVLGLSFYIQRRVLSRPQLITALIMALAGGMVPVVYCSQTGKWPLGLVPFLLLQAWLATASTLESRRPISPRT